MDAHATARRRRQLSPLPLILAGIALVGLAGCETPVSSPPGGAVPSAGGKALGLESGPTVGSADEFLVVDCLLPARIRRLGGQLTYLGARRAVRTAGVDCEIRGGEYVAYDRANYQTALAVWMQPAGQGDPQAQNYVGEIYERGLGLAPDHAEAARWYRLAADQGYSPAQMNLGQLYEQGLGVSKDQVAALNWYRRASGFEEAGLTFVVSSDVASELEGLRDEVMLRADEADQLRSQLKSTEGQIARLEEQRRTAALSQPSAPSRPTALTPPSGPSRPDPDQAAAARQLEALAAERQALERERQLAVEAVAALERQKQAMDAERRLMVAEQQRLEARKAEARDDQQALAEVEQLLANLRAREQELTQRVETAAAREAAQARRDGEIAEREAAIQALQAELRAREADLAAREAALRDRQQVPHPDAAEIERKLDEIQSERQALDQERELAMKAFAELERRTHALDAERRLLAAEEEKLEARKAQAESNQESLGEIDQLLADLRNRQLELTQRAEALAAEEAERGAREAAIAQRESAIAAREAELHAREAALAGREEQLSGREQALEAKQGEVSELDQELAELRQVFEERRQQLVALTTQRDVALAGPVISMLEPKLPPTRGKPVIQTRMGAGERELVGRVEAPAGLLSLAVNERPQAYDEHNLFRSTVPLGVAGSEVSIVAIDRQGKRDDLSFVLRPREGSSSPADIEPAAGVAPVAKLPSLDLGRFHALVIGNDAYTGLPRLDTAVADAEAIGRVLGEKYGFEVTLLRNANRYQILSALNQYRANLTENDNFLIYYAGHGELDQANQRGHWLPVDAEPDSSANWISNVQITDILNAMSAKRILVVADSCYSGSLTRASLAQLDSGMSEEARLSWLRALAKNRSRTALTSGGLQPTLDSGGGGHSVFARALLEVLERNNDLIEGQRLHREVSARVTFAAEQVRFEQVPQYAPIKYAGHEAGEFFLVPGV